MTPSVKNRTTSLSAMSIFLTSMNDSIWSVMPSHVPFVGMAVTALWDDAVDQDVLVVPGHDHGSRPRA